MRVEGLIEIQLAIIEAIIDGALAWSTVEQLGRDLRREGDDLADELVELEVSGWVETWEEWPQGIAVTLTPLAARLLEVRIVEVGSSESPRWARSGMPEPRASKAKGWLIFPSMIENIVDPSPGPVELAMMAEVKPVSSVTEEMCKKLWINLRREVLRSDHAKKRRKEARKAKRRKASCSS
jgi:hypothetical protein